VSNEVLKSGDSISLVWRTVSGADNYRIQVSGFIDFSDNIIDDSSLVTSSKTFTNPSGNGVYFWRWASIDSGVQSVWSQVSKYIVNSSLTDEIIAPTGDIMFINKDDVTDNYTFEISPKIDIMPERINRAFLRNLQGDLLSEKITTKDLITLSFSDPYLASRNDRNEIIRFAVMQKSFYIATCYFDGDDYIHKVWEVEYEDDPELITLYSRQDYFNGDIVLTEV